MVPLVPYSTYGTDELAEGITAAVGGGGKAALLANHGALALGRDLAEAARGAEMLEFLATVYHHALAVGEPVVLPDQEIEVVRERHRDYGQPDTGARGRVMAAAADLVLTIDAGGSGVKATVLSAASGRLLACARHGYRASFPVAGHAEWEPATWWSVVLEACRDAVAQAGAAPAEYAGVTATGMRGPFVLVDGEGEHVAPGVLVPDQRGAAQLPRIEAAIGRERLYERTGHWLSARWGLCKLLWFAEAAPATLGRARHVLQLHDWLVQRLCGAVVSEPSSASMSQLLDIRRRAWASDLLGELGLGELPLPALVDAGTRAGGLLAGVAGAVGLLAGTPVHAGGGDTHVSALGVSAVDDGTIAVVAGTTTAIQLTDETVPARSEQAPLVSAHLRPGRYALETNAGETGAIYRWLADLGADGAPDGAAALERLAQARAAGRARPARHGGAAALGRGGVGPARAGDAVRHARRALARRPRPRRDRVRDIRDRVGDRRAGGVAGRRRGCGSAPPAAPAAARCGRRRSPTSSAARSRSRTSPSRRRPAGRHWSRPGAERGWGEPAPTRRFEPEPERHERYAAHAARYGEVFARLDAAFGEAA